MLNTRVTTVGKRMVCHRFTGNRSYYTESRIFLHSSWKEVSFGTEGKHISTNKRATYKPFIFVLIGDVFVIKKKIGPGALLCIDNRAELFSIHFSIVCNLHWLYAPIVGCLFSFLWVLRLMAWVICKGMLWVRKLRFRSYPSMSHVIPIKKA